MCSPGGPAVTEASSCIPFGKYTSNPALIKTASISSANTTDSWSKTPAAMKIFFLSGIILSASAIAVFCAFKMRRGLEAASALSARSLAALASSCAAASSRFVSCNAVSAACTRSVRADSLADWRVLDSCLENAVAIAERRPSRSRYCDPAHPKLKRRKKGIRPCPHMKYSI